jgi:hypothetical protein
LVGCEIPRDKRGTNAKANAVPGYVCKKTWLQFQERPLITGEKC